MVRFFLPQSIEYFRTLPIGEQFLTKEAYRGETLQLPHELAFEGPRLQGGEHVQSRVDSIHTISHNRRIPRIVVRITLPDDSPASIDYTTRVQGWYNWKRRLEREEQQGQEMLNLGWR